MFLTCLILIIKIQMKNIAGYERVHDRSTDIVDHCCPRCDSRDRSSHPTSSTTGVVLDFMSSSTSHGIQEGRQNSFHFSFTNILLSCNVPLRPKFRFFFPPSPVTRFRSFSLFGESREEERGWERGNCGRGPHFFWVCSLLLLLLGRHFFRTKVKRPLDETVFG